MQRRHSLPDIMPLSVSPAIIGNVIGLSSRPVWRLAACFSIRLSMAVAIVAGGLSGCAAPAPGTEIHAALSWTAAIGRLDDAGDAVTCSATLVAPDIIVTAAHCLFPAGRAVDPATLVFRPNLGAGSLPTAQGRSIIALGNDRIDPSRPQDVPAMSDWALIRITPDITAVPPVPISDLKVGDIGQHLASGARLSQAGYGADGFSAGDRLSQRINCRLTTDDDLPAAAIDLVLVTDCRISRGDSGGPMILTDTDGGHSLVGIISGYGLTQHSGGRISFGPAAANFVRDIPVSR
jgi:hypothetical protein